MNRDTILTMGVFILNQACINAQICIQQGKAIEANSYIQQAESAIIADALPPVKYLLLEGMFGRIFNPDVC